MDMIRDRLGRLGKGNIANVSFISVVVAPIDPRITIIQSTTYGNSCKGKS